MFQAVHEAYQMLVSKAAKSSTNPGHASGMCDLFATLDEFFTSRKHCARDNDRSRRRDDAFVHCALKPAAPAYDHWSRRDAPADTLGYTSTSTRTHKRYRQRDDPTIVPDTLRKTSAVGSPSSTSSSSTTCTIESAWRLDDDTAVADTFGAAEGLQRYATMGKPAMRPLDSISACATFVSYAGNEQNGCAYDWSSNNLISASQDGRGVVGAAAVGLTRSATLR
jgi:hypothetical protein